MTLCYAGSDLYSRVLSFWWLDVWWRSAMLGVTCTVECFYSDDLTADEALLCWSDLYGRVLLFWWLDGWWGSAMLEWHVRYFHSDDLTSDDALLCWEWPVRSYAFILMTWRLMTLCYAGSDMYGRVFHSDDLTSDDALLCWEWHVRSCAFILMTVLHSNIINAVYVLLFSIRTLSMRCWCYCTMPEQNPCGDIIMHCAAIPSLYVNTYDNNNIMIELINVLIRLILSSSSEKLQWIYTRVIMTESESNPQVSTSQAFGLTTTSYVEVDFLVLHRKITELPICILKDTLRDW